MRSTSANPRRPRRRRNGRRCCETVQPSALCGRLRVRPARAQCCRPQGPRAVTVYARSLRMYGPTPREAKQRPCGDAIVPRRPILRSHELFSKRAVRCGADRQVPWPSVFRDVDWRATEQGAEVVEQGPSEQTNPVLGCGHHRCGQTVGQRGLGDRCDQPSVGDGQFDDVHAGEGRAPRDICRRST